MRKLMLICLFAITALTASAQKFALLDMEYILKNIPAYERANEQLNQVSKKWQAEVEALNTEASTMYRPANVPTLANPSLICTESSADFAS